MIGKVIIAGVAAAWILYAQPEKAEPNRPCSIPLTNLLRGPFRSNMPAIRPNAGLDPGIHVEPPAPPCEDPPVGQVVSHRSPKFRAPALPWRQPSKVDGWPKMPDKLPTR